jgi:hypothetical protein
MFPKKEPEYYGKRKRKARNLFNDSGGWLVLILAPADAAVSWL